MTTLPNAANDSASTVAPLYDQPGKADTLSPQSLARPLGLVQNGGVATTEDSPTLRSSPLFYVADVYRGGVYVADVRYSSLSYLAYKAKFRTYGVLWNQATSTRSEPLRETGWAIDVRSNATTTQKATSWGTHRSFSGSLAPDYDPDPRPGVDFANDLFNLPENLTRAPIGTTTRSFVR